MSAAELLIDFSTLSYRNGIYQGLFSKHSQARHGFGLAYTTDRHAFIASHWDLDEPSGPTFVFHSHAHYMYGFWESNKPQGFNCIRIGSMLAMAFYESGIIVGKLLILFEKYNLLVALEDVNGQWQESDKREVYLDQDFDRFAHSCGWPSFEESWKTLIKFISAYFVNSIRSSEQRLKLRLINGTNYRYGFDEGLAVVFDDDYQINSMGMHRKAKLKSLGIRYLDNLIEEGDFSSSNQIFAFKRDGRPHDKIGKLYSHHLLQGLDFINKFLVNPAQPLFDYFKELSRTHLFQRLVSGQITNRKLDITLSSPGTRRSNDSPGKIRHIRTEEQPPFISPPSKNSQVRQSKTSQSKLSRTSNYKSKQELEEEKYRLEEYKRQINEKIANQSKHHQAEQKKQSFEARKIIHKDPVLITSKTQATPARIVHQDREQSRSRSRSPIFTPDNSPKSFSPTAIASPFNEKIKSKIFKSKPKFNHRNYVYEPIDKPPPRLSTQDPDINKYQSPHQALEFSREQNGTKSSRVMPLTIRPEKQERDSRAKDSGTKYEEIEALPLKLIPKKTFSFGPSNEEEFKKKKKVEQPAPIEKANKNEVYLNPSWERRSSKTPTKNKPATYYDRYQRSRNLSRSPVTEQKKNEPRRYERTIQDFNQFNRPYDLVASPKKPEPLSKPTRGSPSRKREYKYLVD